MLKESWSSWVTGKYNVEKQACAFGKIAEFSLHWWQQILIGMGRPSGGIVEDPAIKRSNAGTETKDVFSAIWKKTRKCLLVKLYNSSN